jgi:hypothetical protein
MMGLEWVRGRAEEGEGQREFMAVSYCTGFVKF